MSTVKIGKKKGSFLLNFEVEVPHPLVGERKRARGARICG